MTVPLLATELQFLLGGGIINVYHPHGIPEPRELPSAHLDPRSAMKCTWSTIDSFLTTFVQKIITSLNCNKEVKMTY